MINEKSKRLAVVGWKVISSNYQIKYTPSDHANAMINNNNNKEEDNEKIF